MKSIIRINGTGRDGIHSFYTGNMNFDKMFSRDINDAKRFDTFGLAEIAARRLITNTAFAHIKDRIQVTSAPDDSSDLALYNEQTDQRKRLLNAPDILNGGKDAK